MKKALLTLMCLASMMAVGTNLKAQEATIVLNPGWNWISYPSADTVDFATAFGSFTPATGDIIKMKWGSSATYLENGQWRGTISQFYPGYGYHYKSNRSTPVTLTLGVPLSQVEVTTADALYISSVSAMIGGSVTLDEDNCVFARGVCWGTNPMPTVSSNHTFDGNSAGVFASLLMELTPNTTYYLRAYAVTYYGLTYGEERSFTTLESSMIHGYVDLGLPSGLLWATCNVGADISEGYGDYFAWGETQPKGFYDWSTYQYCNGSANTITKYCIDSDYGYNGFTDDLTILLPEDDAATTNWGAEWRMFTMEEFNELYENTTQIWTTQNGVNGLLFTASNGNRLFLPAAGYRYEDSLYDAGLIGFYRSNLLYVYSSDYGSGFLFDSVGESEFNSPRDRGYPVRPVRPATNHFYVLSSTESSLETFNYVTDVLNSAYEYANIINPHVDITLSNKPSTVVAECNDIHNHIGAEWKRVIAIAPIDYNSVKLYCGMDQHAFNVAPITLPYSPSDPSLYHVFLGGNSSYSGYLSNRIEFIK